MRVGHVAFKQGPPNGMRNSIEPLIRAERAEGCDSFVVGMPGFNGFEGSSLDSQADIYVMHSLCTSKDLKQLFPDGKYVLFTRALPSYIFDAMLEDDQSRLDATLSLIDAVDCVVDTQMTGFQYYAELLKRRSTPVLLVDSGVDMERFNPDVKPAKLPGQLKLLWADSIINVQRPWNAIFATKMLANGTSKAVLTLIVKSELVPRIKRLASQLGISDNINAIPQVDDIERYYAGADVVIACTAFHSSEASMCTKEALACGKPVIVQKSAGWAPAQMRSNDDPRSIADAIGKLAMDDALRAPSLYRDLAAARFDVRKTASQMIRIYKSVLEG